MANQTPNYGLHQWEPSDNFLRTDFNEDLEKIDTAIQQTAQAAAGAANQLKKKCEVSYGVFRGNGQQTYQISLGFRPKVVAVAGCAVPFYTYMTAGNYSHGSLRITANGFETGTGSGSAQNEPDRTYIYFALK